MHLGTIATPGTPSGTTAVLYDPDRGVIAIGDIARSAGVAAPLAGDDLYAIIRSGRVPELVAAAVEMSGSAFRARDEVSFTAPYRHPRLIWGSA